MRHAILTAALVAAPRALFACPVCFGQNDSPMASAMNLGIFAMLGVIVAVLGGFATFIVHLVRRARLVEEATAAGAAGPFTLPGADPQGETAQC